MAANPVIDRHRSDRRLFAFVAILFPIIVLIGFAPTYYLKPLFASPPIPSTLVHAHGILMGLWVVLFIVQVWLIRSKNMRLHMTLGKIGAALGVLIIIAGFLTGVAAGKYGSNSNPPDIPALVFMVVPMFDVVFFAAFFGAAIYFRKRPADHKRMILLTVINLLPPSIGRFPFAFVLAGGPLVFFGVPALCAIFFIIYDKLVNGVVNKPFVIGAVLLILSYPARLALGSTNLWMQFATWLTSWAA